MIDLGVVDSEALDVSTGSKPVDVAFAEVSIEEDNPALVVVVNGTVFGSEAPDVSRSSKSVDEVVTENLTKSQKQILKVIFFYTKGHVVMSKYFYM